MAPDPLEGSENRLGSQYKSMTDKERNPNSFFFSQIGESGNQPISQLGTPKPNGYSIRQIPQLWQKYNIKEESFWFSSERLHRKGSTPFAVKGLELQLL